MTPGTVAEEHGEAAAVGGPGGLRVAVTGGSGKLGRAVVAELCDHGYEVFNFDLVPPPPGTSSVPFTRIDLHDFGQAVETLAGIDSLHRGVNALVHLAAIPGPTHAGNAATFANNVTAAYNVYAAARLAGVRNVVFASSETLLGYPFVTPPLYVPLDEEVPVLPEVTYALGKDLEEEMARQFCRWQPDLKMVGLRFSNVMDTSDYAGFPDFDSDPRSRSWNLWSYIDARDGARAVRLALEFAAPGFYTFVIASPDTVMSRSTASLMAEVFPGVPVRQPLGEHESLISCAKARKTLGFAPRFSWRDEVS